MSSKDKLDTVENVLHGLGDAIEDGRIEFVELSTDTNPNYKQGAILKLYGSDGGCVTIMREGKDIGARIRVLLTQYGLLPKSYVVTGTYTVLFRFEYKTYLNYAAPMHVRFNPHNPELMAWMHLLPYPEEEKARELFYDADGNLMFNLIEWNRALDCVVLSPVLLAKEDKLRPFVRFVVPISEIFSIENSHLGESK
jgi:hypothetical protein